jgi:hypothetical protein
VCDAHRSAQLPTARANMAVVRLLAVICDEKGLYITILLPHCSHSVRASAAAFTLCECVCTQPRAGTEQREGRSTHSDSSVGEPWGEKGGQGSEGEPGPSHKWGDGVPSYVQWF